MSGRDEIPESVRTELKRNSLACEECGSTTWKQFQNYSSIISVDLVNNYDDESDIEWYSGDNWMCDNCENRPSTAVEDILRERV